ncbi:hypothetical protein GCM10022404_14440 [Celeribacter arenosi]|uniref:Transposase n=1 Tax=Celeribacter arenosi TaxID=792649 RepID=A0ABP7K5Z9_9RHOB
MDYFVGLDVSLRSAAVCVIDGEGRTVLERSSCRMKTAHCRHPTHRLDAAVSARFTAIRRWRNSWTLGSCRESKAASAKDWIKANFWLPNFSVAGVFSEGT